MSYEISLSAATNPPPIHIAYGFRNTDLYRSLGILLGFIVSPILLLLWMRRSALSIGKMDPVAAWFSYFRVLNWSSNGAVLLWMVSGLGARQSLQHWLRFTAGVSWKSSLGEFLIALGPAWLVYFICIDLSYPVFAQLRGDSSRRAEFLLQHMLTVGAQVLPLVLFFTGIEIWNYSARLAVLIQLDKVTGSWLTHPSTLHRVQRIAAESGMPAERLRQILDRHTIEQTQQGGIGFSTSTRSEQHYQFPPVADPDRISSTAQRFRNSQRKLWALLSLNACHQHWSPC